MITSNGIGGGGQTHNILITSPNSEHTLALQNRAQGWGLTWHSTHYIFRLFPLCLVILLGETSSSSGTPRPPVIFGEIFGLNSAPGLRNVRSRASRNHREGSVSYKNKVMAEVNYAAQRETHRFDYHG